MRYFDNTWSVRYTLHSLNKWLVCENKHSPPLELKSEEQHPSHPSGFYGLVFGEGAILRGSVNE